MGMCYRCKGSMTPGTRTHVVDLGKYVVVIRHVPCMECSQCGEAYYTDEVQQRLDEIVKTVSSTMTEVAIVEYSVTAA